MAAKLVSNEEGCNCQSYLISLVIVGLLCAIVILGLVILLVLLLIVFCTDPDGQDGGQFRRSIQRKVFWFFKLKVVKLPHSV